MNSAAPVLNSTLAEVRRTLHQVRSAAEIEKQ